MRDKNSIKKFIIDANKLCDSLFDDAEYSSKVIGKYDDIEVQEFISINNSFEKIKEVLNLYFSDEMIEVELHRRQFVNLNGLIGRIAAAGENNFEINESSEIKVLEDSNSKKIVMLKVINDYNDTYEITYTLVKSDNGNWRITFVNGYIDNGLATHKKELYYNK